MEKKFQNAENAIFLKSFWISNRQEFMQGGVKKKPGDLRLKITLKMHSESQEFKKFWSDSDRKALALTIHLTMTFLYAMDWRGSHVPEKLC